MLSRREKKDETECTCMHIDRRVRALHIFSINPREISHPRLAHTIYNRPCPPAVLRVFFARAPAPSFPFLSPRGGRNRRFFRPRVPRPRAALPEIVLPFIRTPFLDRLCLSGTHEARGSCNCTRHISPTGRGEALCEVDVHALKRRRVYYDFGVTSSFFCFLFSLFHFTSPAFFFSLSFSSHSRPLYVTSVVGKRRAHCR